MIKEIIKYTDYDGVEKVKECYFHLTAAEVAEMQLSYGGDLQEKLETVVASSDNRVIVNIFKEFILKAYGEKTLDGRFFKNDDIRDTFAASEAYSELYLKMLRDAEFAANFINSIIPRPTSKVSASSPTMIAPAHN